MWRRHRLVGAELRAARHSTFKSPSTEVSNWLRARGRKAVQPKDCLQKALARAVAPAVAPRPASWSTSNENYARWGMPRAPSEALVAAPSRQQPRSALRASWRLLAACCLLLTACPGVRRARPSGAVLLLFAHAESSSLGVGPRLWKGGGRFNARGDGFRFGWPAAAALCRALRCRRRLLLPASTLAAPAARPSSILSSPTPQSPMRR